MLTAINLLGAPGARVRAGISVSIGNLHQSIGLFSMAHIYEGHIQGGARLEWQIVPKAWGHGKNGNEMQLSGMLGAGFGKDINTRRMYLDIASSALSYYYQINYIYIWYKDSYNSSQRTGAVSSQFGNVRVLTENDFFGEHRSDKWRTAGVLISAERDSIEAGIKLVLWTGDSFDDNVRVHKESGYPARFGYRDLSKTVYGKFSLGALGLQARTDKFYEQSSCLYAGVDAEQIRNIFQNKFMHDLWFVPKSLISYPVQNYPMLDTEGYPYLNDSTATVRPPRAFIQAETNTAPFY